MAQIKFERGDLVKLALHPAEGIGEVAGIREDGMVAILWRGSSLRDFRKPTDLRLVDDAPGWLAQIEDTAAAASRAKAGAHEFEPMPTTSHGVVCAKCGRRRQGHGS